jgi:hypothetical protein
MGSAGSTCMTDLTSVWAVRNLVQSSSSYPLEQGTKYVNGTDITYFATWTYFATIQFNAMLATLVCMFCNQIFTFCDLSNAVRRDSAQLSTRSLVEGICGSKVYKLWSFKFIKLHWTSLAGPSTRASAICAWRGGPDLQMSTCSASALTVYSKTHQSVSQSVS